MKNIIHFSITALLIVVVSSCTKREIPLYESPGYDFVYFTKPSNDSTTLSFFFHPGKETVDIPLQVEIIGSPSTVDREIPIVVDPQATTASAANYELPNKFILRAGRVVDTVYVKMKKTDDLQTQYKYLSLKIEENQYFKPGPFKNIFAKISITNQASKPAWWDPNNYVETYGESYYELGRFTVKKFALFITVTGVSDLSAVSEAEALAAMLQFKYYLIQKKTDGQEVMEDDGTPMTVYVVG